MRRKDRRKGKRRKEELRKVGEEAKRKGNSKRKERHARRDSEYWDLVNGVCPPAPLLG